MEKDHIIAEIRRTAENGKALGVQRFVTVTGIKAHQWRGRFWSKWGDALKEAGYSANEWTPAHNEEFVVESLIRLTRKLGKFPTITDMDLERRANADFPASRAVSRFGSQAELVSKLLEYCRFRGDFADLLPVLEKVEVKRLKRDAEKSSPSADGYVYLVRAQNAYKIGCTRAPYRRTAELANQSANGAELVHLIPTDDPEGIERYWHDRFNEKRIAGRNKQSGEWFQLTRDDVKAFSRRKGFM